MPSDIDALSRTVIGQVPFSVSARVAIQLGRESISSSAVAILELVKNAYDADADNVWIMFSDLNTGSPSLVIEDDGIGMSERQLLDNWMIIGTDNKLVSRRSAVKKRTLVGEKGLGRLGLDRLCKSTLVQSFKLGEHSAVELDIDWDKYETAHGKLEAVTHTLSRIPKLARSPVSGALVTKTKGIRLEMRNLRDKWAQEDIRKLRIDLSLLVSPFAGINDFAIWLSTNMDGDDVDGRIVSSQMLEAAEWKVVSKVDETGRVHHLMSSLNGEVQYEYSKTWLETFRDAGTPTPRCGPLDFEFHFIPRQDVEALSLKRAQIDSFLDTNQGIRIYRDGFRVKPYGEPSGDGDWLSLSYRRMQSPQGVRQSPGGWRVGYNQVVGAVFLTRKRNCSLLDQTNREGIIDGPALEDLRRFALHSVRFFELQRERYEVSRHPVSPIENVREKASEASQASSNAIQHLKTAVGSALALLDASPPPGNKAPPTAGSVRTILTDAVTLVEGTVADAQILQQRLSDLSQEQQQELQRQKNTLGNLASLGILAATFGHETQGESNVVLSNAQLLRENVQQLIFVEDQLRRSIAENVENIEYAAKRIETFAHFILQNVRRDKRQRVHLHLEDVARTVFASFSKVLEEDRRIRVDLDSEERLPPILAFRIDWESIFINLITNSVWALENTPRDRRAIRVRIGLHDDHVVLLFADSGRGLEAGTEDYVFLPTFSTKRNRRGDIVGTGMGLSIVKDFVESYNGSVCVDSPSDLGGAEFRIAVPLPKATLGGDR